MLLELIVEGVDVRNIQKKTYAREQEMRFCALLRLVCLRRGLKGVVIY